MNYKTYAEAKIANPGCEIVTAGKDWVFEKSLKGVFQSLGDSGACRHSIGDDAWVICNPADYCSSIEEFLEAGFKLVEGDKFIGIGGCIVIVKKTSEVNVPDDEDVNRYILSAAALNGGCKIPKAEPWTIYSNTLPLSDLSDEQAAMLFNAWRAGGEVEFAHTITKDLKSGFTTFKWSITDILDWGDYRTYRIKQKSERELFIEKTMTGCSFDNSHSSTVQSVTGQMFDAGARYTDLTQHFGENI